MASIQGIYVALFGRPADPTGLDHWNEVTNGGADLANIGDLTGTAEYQDRFTGLTDTRSSTQSIRACSDVMLILRVWHSSSLN
jgi:hypothetical protein